MTFLQTLSRAILWVPPQDTSAPTPRVRDRLNVTGGFAAREVQTVLVPQARGSTPWVDSSDAVTSTPSQHAFIRWPWPLQPLLRPALRNR